MGIVVEVVAKNRIAIVQINNNKRNKFLILNVAS